MGSLAPREDVKAPEARTVLYGEAAAEEIAKYACRLNVKDWSVDAMPFDMTFATKYLAFWLWKGTLQDRRAALRMVMNQPCDYIGAVFGAWRETCARRVDVVDMGHWAGADAPCEWLSQARLSFEENGHGN